MAKILALVSFKIFPPHMGGQKHVALFYEYLNRHHPVYMLASNDNIEAIEASYPVETLLFPNKRMMSNYGLVPEIVEIIKREKIDCIIAEHSYTGWLGHLLRKKTGKPFIIHSHNLEVYRFKQMKRRGWWMYKPYEKWVHRTADHSFFISREEMDMAVHQFGLKTHKCSVSPYGMERPVLMEEAGRIVRKKYNLTTQYIFHFNGTMDYEPNMDAVGYLVNEIAPRLERSGLDHTIVISGKRLPSFLREKVKTCRNMVYLDFIDDINAMYQASHVFLNPVVNNSGVKTKLIEALANNCTVISTVSGASGIPQNCYEGKMFTAKDHDWDTFCQLVQKQVENKSSVPFEFFNYFSWHNIAMEASQVIDQIARDAGK
jgi:polysaccharide biosynthesis protein PslH